MRESSVQAIVRQSRNRMSVAALKRAIRGDGIVPFIGAGLSRQCGYPLWPEFLTRCAVVAGIDISKLLRKGRYEDAAERLLRAMGRRWFNARIQRQFGSRRPCGKDAASLRVPLISRGPVVTTNFDRVLESAFRAAGSPFSYELWGGRPRLADVSLARNTRVLVKIHGDANHHDGRVLTRSDYDRYYGISDGTTPLGKAVLSVVSHRPLLFLGCRIENDRYLRLIRHPSLPHKIRHFAVLPRQKGHRWLRRRARYLQLLGIRPLWYDDGQHHAITEFLDWLARLTVPPRSGPRTPIRNVGDVEKAIATCRTAEDRITVFLQHEDLFWKRGLSADYVRLAQPILRQAERARRFCDALEIANHIASMVMWDERSLRRALTNAGSFVFRCDDADKRADYQYNLAVSLERTETSRARRIYRRLGNSGRPYLRVAALRRLAVLHKSVGNQPAALRALRLAANRSRPFPEQHARSQTQLGMLLDEMGNLDAAERAYARARTIFRRLRDHAGLSGSYDNLGTIALQREHWAHADQMFELAYRHGQLAGGSEEILIARRNQAYARYRRGKARLDSGTPLNEVRRDLEEADEHLADAMVRRRRGHDYAAALTERALLTALLRGVPQALAELAKAARMHRGQKNRQWLWTTEYNRAVILFDDGQRGRARLALLRAMKLARTIGASWVQRTEDLLRRT